MPIFVGAKILGWDLRGTADTAINRTHLLNELARFHSVFVNRWPCRHFSLHFLAALESRTLLPSAASARVLRDVLFEGRFRVSRAGSLVDVIINNMSCFFTWLSWDVHVRVGRHCILLVEHALVLEQLWLRFGRGTGELAVQVIDLVELLHPMGHFLGTFVVIDGIHFGYGVESTCVLCGMNRI